MAGLTKWFLYGTNTGTDQVAKANIERRQPATRLQRTAMNTEDRTLDRRERTKQKVKDSLKGKKKK